MKTNIFKRFSIIGIIGILCFVALSCDNEDPEYPVKIYAKLKSNNSPVPNASVKISKGEVLLNLTTDRSGLATNTFKLPAIFDVEITYTDSITNRNNVTNYYGFGVIKLEEDETVSKTIYLSEI